MHIAIVGGGLVGLGTARALARGLGGRGMGAGVRITVVEKELKAGMHQSTHNSGVLHAGLYYTPGSYKAALAVRGIRMMRDFARAHGVAHETCGKLVVAAQADQVPRLRRLHERGVANGLTGLAWLDAGAAREREPHVRAVAALLVPEEGIIDYGGVVAALCRELLAAGGGAHRLLVGTPVTAARRDGRQWVLATPNEEVRADFVVTCAGLQADRVARLFGVRSGGGAGARVVPFRGDYYALAPAARHLVRHLIYPVPDPAFPFLGVHFTRMIGGGVECGPNAVLSLSREGYRRWAFRASDAADALGFPGLWRFALRHPRATVFELLRAASRRMFLASLRRLVPEVNGRDLERGPVGVRAQAMRADGTLVEDFAFETGPAVLHVINAPSPAATASLAIGEEIARMITPLAAAAP